MLRNLAAVLLVALLAVGSVVAPQAAAPASAACNGSTTEDGYGGADCNIPGDRPGQPGGSGGSGGGAAVCTYSDEIIPCVTDAGYYNGQGCYIKLLDPQPPKDAPIWGDHEDGQIVRCTQPDQCLEDLDIGSGNGVGSHWCAPQNIWLAEMPPAAGVSPLALAERIAAGMHMTMGGIGSTPYSDADSVGLVGVPIWLWVTDPGPGTTESIQASDSEGGVTVTVTGTLDRIEWTLADDGGVYRTVTCSGSDIAGTVWTPQNSDHGRAASPTCGFDGVENSHAGELTLTGTAYWNLTWEGAGQNGDLPVPAQENSTTLTMSEVQVVTQ